MTRRTRWMRLFTAAVTTAAGVFAACSTQYAETARSPAAGAAGASGASGSGASGGDASAGSGASGGDGNAGSATSGSGGNAGNAGSTEPCPESLADRLTVTTFTTDEDIRYKHQGYDLFPVDERVALAVAPDGSFKLAWLENAGTSVRVSSLDAGGERTAPDLVVPGFDIGGLVAHDDGFALLTRRDDPGEPLRAPAVQNTISPAAMLVRVENDTELWAAPLTGTASILDEPRDDHRRDCAPVWLNGRLAYNGEKYGAYFQVHGCEGNWSEPYYGDKLVYADDQGSALSGGWEWKCSINQGSRLLPETGAFTSLCLSDTSPGPGLNVVTEDGNELLASEATTVGFCAGQFGSVVKMGNGSYVVGWLSRGEPAPGSEQEAPKEATDIAIVRLGPDLAPTGPVTWVLETPDTAEANLHLARYGQDQLLVVWDSVTNLICEPTSCFGTYSGTHARLMDLSGEFASEDTEIEAPPATNDDIITLPNGDLAWAFVPDPERNYTDELRLDDDGVPIAPPRRELAVARLRNCR